MKRHRSECEPARPFHTLAVAIVVQQTRRSGERAFALNAPALRGVSVMTIAETLTDLSPAA